MSTQADLFGSDTDQAPTCDDCGDPIPHAKAKGSGLCQDCGLKVGRAYRDEALDALEVYRSQLVSQVRSRLKARAREEHRPTFTANDAYRELTAVIEDRKQAGLPVEEDVDRRLLGAVFIEDCWTKTGDYVESQRPDQHARPVAVWRWDP